jgi:hypothetical protein
VAETDSAANQFGAHESVNQRGIFPLFVPRVCPSPFVGFLNRRER